jgi:Family of unknown function (DUF6082)
MSGYEFFGTGPVMTARRILKVTLFALLVTVFIVAAGIMLVVTVGGQGDPETWARWGNVGQTFEAVNSVVSALAIGGILISWFLQSHQMQIARQTLQRGVDAEVRNQHVILIQMAINDPDLAAVWPAIGGNDQRTQRQYQYANLLIQHVWLQYTAGIATREEMVSNLRFLFASPKIRAFWEGTTKSRQSIYVEGSRELDLASFANQILAEYQAVLACAGDAGPFGAVPAAAQRESPAMAGPATQPEASPG